MSRSGLLSYENRLLLVLGLSFGMAFFDRTAGTVLVPFIEQELHLDNTKVGLLGGGLSLTWAFGAYLIGRWSDASGVRKPFLLAFLVIFSVCSVVSGLAHSYPTLLASRMVMGAVEGPFLPVCLALMVAESSEHRRGVNAGIMQNFFASIIGQSLAPSVLVPLAEHLGWRTAFFIAGVPGLVCAVAVLLWVREPRRNASEAVVAESAPDHLGLIGMLGVRNILLCCLISIFMVSWLIMGWNFLPKFFVDSRHIAPAQMGNLMTVLGVASALSSFTIPAISDRIGRKPAVVLFSLLGVATPLGALLFHGPLLLLGALMFVGWLAAGVFPLFMGVIPGETISRRYAATAMGLIVCVGEIVGGTLINGIGGYLGDHWNPAAPIWVQAACAVAGGLLALLLIETAPIKVHAAAAATLTPAPARDPAT